MYGWTNNCRPTRRFNPDRIVSVWRVVCLSLLLWIRSDVAALGNTVFGFPGTSSGVVFLCPHDIIVGCHALGTAGQDYRVSVSAGATGATGAVGGSFMDLWGVNNGFSAEKSVTWLGVTERACVLANGIALPSDGSVVHCHVTVTPKCLLYTYPQFGNVSTNQGSFDVYFDVQHDASATNEDKQLHTDGDNDVWTFSVHGDGSANSPVGIVGLYGTDPTTSPGGGTGSTGDGSGGTGGTGAPGAPGGSGSTGGTGSTGSGGSGGAGGSAGGSGSSGSGGASGGGGGAGGTGGTGGTGGQGGQGGVGGTGGTGGTGGQGGNGGTIDASGPSTIPSPSSGYGASPDAPSPIDGSEGAMAGLMGLGDTMKGKVLAWHPFSTLPQTGLDVTSFNLPIPYVGNVTCVLPLDHPSIPIFRLACVFALLLQFCFSVMKLLKI